MSVNEEDLNKTFKLEGVEVTLADLAGINLDEVKELRGEAFPKGVYIWEVDSEKPPHLTVVGEGDKAKGAAVFRAKCLDVLTVSDPEFTGDNSTLIGKVHQETFFLTNPESLGYLKAFMKDIGAPYSPNVVTLLSGSVGTRFQAPIGKRKDKDDADKVYTNLVRNKLKPLGAAEVSEVASAVS
jgi:hypothetical protein